MLTKLRNTVVFSALILIAGIVVTQGASSQSGMNVVERFTQDQKGAHVQLTLRWSGKSSTHWSYTINSRSFDTGDSTAGLVEHSEVVTRPTVVSIDALNHVDGMLCQIAVNGSIRSEKRKRPGTLTYCQATITESDIR